MNHLLYIPASPRGNASHSTGVAQVFLETYQDIHPDATVDTMDLWAEPLPPYARQGANALMFGDYGVLEPDWTPPDVPPAVLGVAPRIVYSTDAEWGCCSRALGPKVRLGAGVRSSSHARERARLARKSFLRRRS